MKAGLINKQCNRPSISKQNNNKKKIDSKVWDILAEHNRIRPKICIKEAEISEVKWILWHNMEVSLIRELIRKVKSECPQNSSKKPSL